MFLVGAKPIETGLQSNIAPTIAVAWDNVDLLTIYESLEAYLRRDASPNLAEVPIEFRITRLRAQVEDLRPEIERRKRFVATTEVEIEKLKAASKKAEDTDTRIAIEDRRRRRREEELVAIQKKLVDLNSERRRLEVLAEQMSHQALLRGRLP